MANTKITSRVLADDAVLTANITDANVTTAKIADSNVTVAKMAANSVDSDQYVDGSIDLAHMSVNSIDSDQYVDGSIDLAHMSDNSVDSDQYVDGSIDTAHIANDQVTADKLAHDINLVGNPTTTTQSSANSTTRIATTAFVQQELTTLIGGAPSTLNDLNELAAAINDDANYNSTLTTALATKLPLAGGTMTGNLNVGGGGIADPTIRIDSASGGDPTLIFDGSAANRSALIKFYDNGSAVGGFIDYIHNGDKMNFGSGSSANVTMTVGDTKVGIGTTSPASPLHIKTSTNHNLEFEEASGDLRISALNDARDANEVLQFAASEFNFLTGNVGIGTTSPSGQLHVQIASRTTDYSAANASTWGDIVVTNPSGAVNDATGIAFYNNGSYHTNAATGIAIIKDSGSAGDYGSHMAFVTRPHAAVAVERMRIQSDGAITMGGTLGVTGAITGASVTTGNSNLGSNSSHLANLTVNNNGYIGSANDSTALNFTTAGDLVATGKLGIGTSVNTAPTARLDIAGMAAGEQALLITTGRNDALSNGLARINITDVNCPFTGLQIDYAGTGTPLHIKRADGTALVVESTNDQNNTGDRVAMEFKTDAAQGIAKIIGGKEGNYQSSGARSGYLAFHTIKANTYAERMRITSDGDFLSNTTTAVGSFYNGVSGIGFGYSAGGYGAFVRAGTAQPLYVSTNSQGTGGFIEFSQNGAQRGVISYNGSVMVYGGTSDHRLKENVTPIENALTKVSALNPISFTWKENGSAADGFLAHEAQEVVPYAVQGQKDAVYTDENSPEEKENGEPFYQTMEYGKLTPLLVKAIQEQQTIIDDLKARIATLEG